MRRLLLAVLACVLSTQGHAQNDPAGLIAECDRLAASDLDRGRPAGVPGVLYGRIDATASIPACAAAVKADPNNARLHYQLARAFQRGMQLQNLGAAYGSLWENARNAYRAAIERGSLPAMNELAEMLRYGQGVPHDPAEAAKMYEKVAGAGLPMAMYNLAVLYRTGEGVAKDENRSQHWFRQARVAFQADIQLGSPTAMHTVGLMHQAGMGGAQDHAQARALFARAAQLGHPLSPLHLKMLGGP